MTCSRIRIAAWFAALSLITAACGSAVPTSSWSSIGPSSAAGSAMPTAAPTPTAVPTPAPTPAEADLTLMDFNIEYGGDEVDFDKIVEAIRLADPDVVALEEAEGNTAKVAEALGWKYHSVRTQLVSKLPLIDPPGADGRYEYVELAPGAVVAIANVHLPSDPYGPYDVRDGKTPAEVIALETTTRLPPLQARLDAVGPLVTAGIPAFITGDFNAPSHLDWTAAAVGKRPHIKYALAWPVSMALEASGFRDTYRELNPDPVAAPGLTWWAGRPLIDGYPDPSEPQDRIDIIYAAGPSTTVSTKIVGEKGGPQVDIEVDPWGTDHRGIVATFRVRPGVPAPFVAAEPRLVRVGEAIGARYHTGGASGHRLVLGTPATLGVRVIAEQALQRVDGVARFTDPLEPGDYLLQLQDANGTALAGSPVSVAAAESPVTLTLADDRVTAGLPITVTWRDAPGARWDWIGIYEEGGDPLADDYIAYAYTGSTVQGTVTLDATAEGPWPLPPGRYDVHYLSDDGYASLAVAPVTITN